MPCEQDSHIKEAAMAPKKFKTSEGEVEAHSLREQLEVQKDADRRRAAAKKNRGIGAISMRTPGAH